jgi:hypothetical protein
MVNIFAYKIVRRKGRIMIFFLIIFIVGFLFFIFSIIGEKLGWYDTFFFVALFNFVFGIGMMLMAIIGFFLECAGIAVLKR